MAKKVKTKMIIIRTINYKRLVFFSIYFIFSFLFVISSSLAEQNKKLNSSKLQSLYGTLDASWQNGNYNEVLRNGEELLSKIDNTPDSKSVTVQLLDPQNPIIILPLLLSPFHWPDLLGRFGDATKSKIEGWDEKLIPNSLYTPIDRHLTETQQRNLFRLMGLAAVKAGDNYRSAKYLKKYIDIEEKFRLTIMREDRRSGYMSTYYEDIGYLVDALVSVGKIWEAFQYAEFSKAKSISELLISSHLSKTGSLKRELVRKINIAKAQGESIAAKEFIDKSEIEELDRSIKVLGKQEVTKTNYEDVFFLTKNLCPKLLDKKDLGFLTKNVALITYFVSKEFIIYFIYHDGNIITWTKKNISRSELELLIKNFSELAQKNHSNFQNVGSRLHGILVKPFLNYLKEKGIKQLLISPHSVLRDLSFAGLKGDLFLIYDYDISYIFSANFISIIEMKDKEKKLNNVKALIIGNPHNETFKQPLLPSAEIEAFQIAKLIKEKYGSNSATFLKHKNATESLVKIEMIDSNIIHLATHSKVDRSEGDNSFIYLADDVSNDGILYAHELYNISSTVPWELVVLSSCESGSVDLKTGDDPYGLTRTLFFSGAKRIISTFWNINDQSATRIMINFYKKLLQDGLPAVSALCRTLAEESVSGDLTWISFKIEGKM